ncbi:MAG: hypothetical protein WKF81_03565 [Thermomicrobiales bacterium]
MAIATEDAEPTVAGPIASPSSVLRSRGAPDSLYSLTDNVITSVVIAEHQTSITEWSAQSGVEIAAIDGAPDGSRVAAILIPDVGDASMVIYDAAGAEQTRFDNLIAMDTLRATPVSDGTGGVTGASVHVTVAWASLGDQILVSSSDGQLVSVPSDGGDPIVYTPSSPLDGLQDARWSPDGSRIGAFLRNAAGLGRIEVLTPDGATVSRSESVGRENLPVGFSVEQFNWSVDGSSLFYVVADRTEGNPLGGQLYELILAKNSPILIATSGRGGPSGTIESFVLSPDGRSIAIVIAVIDADTVTFHSLLVKSLRNGSTYDVLIGSQSSVPEIWWAADGLVWNRDTADGSEFTIEMPGDIREPLINGARQGTPVPQATPAPLG